MGKAILTGPIKPNEPVKKGETKKSFLSNTGKALQGTPRRLFTPHAVNMGPLIYSDPDASDKRINDEEFEFSKPTYKYGKATFCQLFVSRFHQDFLRYRLECNEGVQGKLILR